MLQIAPEIKLPLDAVTQVFAILGRRGSGKTNTAVVLAEELMTAHQQIVVLDPMGNWYGLRSSRDGKRAGFPIVILGGSQGDVPLEPRGGRVVADFVVGERVSCILDVSLFGENEMLQFVADFARQFYRINKEVVHLFVDEADTFCPQSTGMRLDGGGPGPQCLGAVQNLARRGRHRGIGMTVITQRSAVISKSVLSQTECLVAHQTTGPQDLAAIHDWLKHQGTPEETKQIIATLPRLKRGQAWLYSPAWLETLAQIKVRHRETFDSSETPQAGQSRRHPKRVADIDMDRLQKSMSCTIEKARREDPKELHKEISALKQDLKRAQQQTTQVVKEIKVPTVSPELRKSLKHTQRLAGELAGSLEKILACATSLQTALVAAQEGLETPAVTTPPRYQPVMPARREPLTRREPAAPRQNGELPKLPSGARRMIEVLVRQHPLKLTERQWATLAKLRPTSGTWGTYRSLLTSAGLIEPLAQLDGYGPTDHALDTFSSYAQDPQTLEERIAMWSGRLPGGALRMFNILVAHYPDGLTRETLAEESALAHNSGTFGTYLSILTSNGLAEQQGRGEAATIRAGEALYIGL